MDLLLDASVFTMWLKIKGSLNKEEEVKVVGSGPLAARGKTQVTPVGECWGRREGDKSIKGEESRGTSCDCRSVHSAPVCLRGRENAEKKVLQDEDQTTFPPAALSDSAHVSVTTFGSAVVPLYSKVGSSLA